MSYAIIIGGGRVGYHLTRSLINNDYEVLLLEKDPGVYRPLAADLGDVMMQGDGCDPLTLKAAGIERADLVIAATGDDPANLVISQLAQNCFKRPRIIAVVNHPHSEELFEKLGVHERVSVTAAALNLLGQKVSQGPVILLGALERSNIEVIEILVDGNSPFLDAKLGDLNLPKGTLIISVLRQGEALIPNAHTVFERSDVLVTLIPQELEATLREFIV
jgi:trk system potassium uptake protein TrkA